MNAKTIAILLHNNNVMGYAIEEYLGNERYRSFEKEVSEIPDSIRTVPISTEINIAVNTTEKIDEILDKVPIGTALRLTGCCEGMNNQQLIFVGKQKDNLVGIEWYYFYDGNFCVERGVPCAFGFSRKQLNYEDTIADFTTNDEKGTTSLRQSYSFLREVCKYL